VGCGYMGWIGLAQDRDRWRKLVSAVMNLRVPWNAGNFLTSSKPVSFSRRTLHHGVSININDGILGCNVQPVVYKILIYNIFVVALTVSQWNIYKTQCVFLCQHFLLYSVCNCEHQLDWSVYICLTQLYDGRDMYRIYYIKNNYMFRPFTSAIFRFRNEKT